MCLELTLSECMSLTPRYLTYLVDGLVGLWCSQVGLVQSAVPAIFYPPSGRNPSCGVRFMYASCRGMTHQQSCDLGTLRVKNSYNRVGSSSREIPIMECEI